MMGAFYAKKMFSHYAPMLNDGAVKLAAWSDIVQTMRDDCATFGVTSIAAYNAAFDFRVMAATHKMLGHTDRILPAGLKKLCIWQFACETKLSQKSYVKMALANGWVSPKGNIKTGAEFAYRYTTHRPEFVEDHTALSDAIIETTILAACFQQKRKTPWGRIGGSPWRIVQPKPVENDAHIHGGVTA
jgi:DNA polymerase III epsilon subunit-like protein